MTKAKKIKINIVDIAIVLIFVLLAFFGYKIVARKVAKAPVTTKVSFVVEFSGADKTLLDSFAVGDEVYESRQNKFYGVISDVKYEKAKAVGTDLVNGTFTDVTYNDEYDIYISVDADATAVTDKDVIVADNPVKVGDRAYIKTDKCVAAGFFVDLQIAEEVSQ